MLRSKVCLFNGRAADSEPVGVNPDTDLTFEKKPGSNPNDKKKNPDPDPEPCILRYGFSLLRTKLRKDFVQVCDSVEVVLIDPVLPGPHVGEVDHGHGHALCQLKIKFDLLKAFYDVNYSNLPGPDEGQIDHGHCHALSINPENFISSKHLIKSIFTSQ